MTDEQASDSSRELRLNELLARYLQAAEAGQVPDRSDFLAQHPDFAAELSEFFADRDRFTQLAGQPPIHPGAEAPTLPPDSPAGPGHSTLETSPRPTLRYFGDYELLSEIARGGMGVVYKARQVKLNRIVAVKMILAGQLAGEDDVKRFLTEAEAAANLRHPHIVAIHEVGEHEGQHYFSMDFIDGRSLADLARQDPLPARKAAEYVRTIADAIQYAHQQGTLHRDLKPSNVLIDANGEPHVTDFGLARRIKGGSELTGTAQVLGTPSYMPPEQAAGNRGAVGPASDVYALGAILYELLVGRPPFRAETPLDTLLQVLDAEPAPPRLLNPQVPHDLETIALKCLEKEPARRYGTAQDLADDLGRYLAGEPVHARPIGRAARGWRWCRRRPLAAGFIGLATLLVLVLAIGGPVVALRERAAAVREAGLRAAVARTNTDLTVTGRALETQLVETRRQTELAQQESHVATARYLASESAAVDDQFPLRRALLAIEALDATARHGEPAVAAAEEALRAALARLGGLPLGQHGHLFTVVAFSADGRTLVTASGDDIARVWDLSAADPTAEPKVLRGHENYVTCLAISPDGRTLVTGSHDSTARVWDLSSSDASAGPKVLRGHEGGISCLAISPDGRTLVTGSLDSNARVWDLSAPDLAAGPKVLRGHEGGISCLAISPDGRTLVTGSLNSTARVWDLSAPDPTAGVKVLRGHEGGIGCLSISPDGRTLVTGSADGTARVWDLSAADPAAGPKVLRHDGAVDRLAISPDGRTLVTGGNDGTARAWDLSVPDQSAGPKVLRGHEHVINCLAITPDGRTLVTGAGDILAPLRDTTARLWHLRVDALRKLAPLLAGRELTADERARYGLAGAPLGPAQAGGAEVEVELFPWQLPRFPRPADAAWHEAQLRDCEARGLTFAAQFHHQRAEQLRRPIGEKP